MTPAQFRNQHGNPTTWTDSDIDSYQVIAETSHETRLAFRMRRLTYPAYQALQAIHHLSTSRTATIAGIALVVFAWLAAPTVIATAFMPVGLYLTFAWAIDGNEKACPICRHNHRTPTTA
ncbi:hypothetical protein ACFVYE_31955 [Streptomyces sp. NPDC058239]|uniref:hypothetical protein n=1 Tax=Streptomyces sp. NPDC058239 TaxID=3346395 RepID=UPI0036E3D2BF